MGKEQNLTTAIRMKDVPKEERPRERLIRHGAERLANRELLAILLRTGNRNESALMLADRLLSRFGSLPELAQTSYEELLSVKGIGPAKAADILAAFELAKRLGESRMEFEGIISNPQDAAQLVLGELSHADKEHFMIIMLNTKHRVIAKKVVSIGHLHASLVHPREMFKEAIKRSSAAVILVHNHPSGDLTPSRDDITTTERLRDVGEMLGIEVLDHIIVGNNNYLSFREQGLL
ncbi:MAG: DNA repair protein RadC [Bacillota bacterium]|jgi:DNA repair protein RadC|nr:DNA repair protein RadC [Bacillota bacterium]NLJ03318.1 DNA repair protein RadC [Bacillota bacterium]